MRGDSRLEGNSAHQSAHITNIETKTAIAYPSLMSVSRIPTVENAEKKVVPDGKKFVESWAKPDKILFHLSC